MPVHHENLPYLGLDKELRAQGALNYHVICDSDPPLDEFRGFKCVSLEKWWFKILCMYGGSYRDLLRALETFQGS